MAGVVGGSTGAAVAAIVMIFDYRVIIPMTITVALSYGIRRMLIKQSIYTLKLVRRGHSMPDALHTNVHFVRRAQEIMDTAYTVVLPSATLGELEQMLTAQEELASVVVGDGEKRMTGVLTRDDVLEALERRERETPAGDVATTNYLAVGRDETISNILAGLRSQRAGVTVVASDGTADRTDRVEG